MRASRPKKRLRAVLLARVSTNQRSQDTSGPRQISDLRDVARRKGWTVAGTFSDRVSGAETGPGLRAAIEMICFRCSAEVLVVHALDRLGRDVREMLMNVDQIRAGGGHFFVRDDEIDTSSPEGRMHFTLLAALAEFQRHSGRHKVIAGIAHARKKGVRLGRPPAMPAPALARAVELRRQRARPSWSTIVRTLEREKRGTFAKGTVAGAVTRALSSARGHP